MPLPLMFRSTHDRELAALERLLALAEQRAADAKADAEFSHRLYELERRRYGELLAKQGTAVAAKSKATEVIRDAARGPDGRVDQRLVAHLRGQYNRLMREGANADDALDAVQQWQSTETGEGLNAARLLEAAGGLKG